MIFQSLKGKCCHISEKKRFVNSLLAAFELRKNTSLKKITQFVYRDKILFKLNHKCLTLLRDNLLLLHFPE